MQSYKAQQEEKYFSCSNTKSWDSISVNRQNILNLTQETLFTILIGRNGFVFFLKNMHQKNHFLLLLSSSTQWVSCDMRIPTVSWHVWECYMWKGLSDFGIPDPEIPASTPGDVAHLGIQKKKNAWETTSCIWCITFLLAVPIIGLQPTSVYSSL